MNAPPRTPPRFLPTLTEVVHKRNQGGVSAPKVINTDDIVRTVLQSVGPEMERRLAKETQDLLRMLVDEQMSILGVCLREEMEILVRQVVSETVISLQEIRPA